MESFYAAVRATTPLVRPLLERYRGDVPFSLDSDGRSLWVMALFGKGATPIAPSRRPKGPPQDERIRKRIYEMLHQERSQTEKCRGSPWMTSKRTTETRKWVRTSGLEPAS